MSYTPKKADRFEMQRKYDFFAYHAFGPQYGSYRKYDFENSAAFLGRLL